MLPRRYLSRHAQSPALVTLRDMHRASLKQVCKIRMMVGTGSRLFTPTRCGRLVLHHAPQPRCPSGVGQASPRAIFFALPGEVYIWSTTLHLLPADFLRSPCHARNPSKRPDPQAKPPNQARPPRKARKPQEDRLLRARCLR